MENREEDIIEELILKELESASEVIPENILHLHLEEGLCEESEKTPRLRFLRVKLSLAFVGILAASVIIIIVFLAFPARKIQENPAASIEKVLEKTPWIQNLNRLRQGGVEFHPVEKNEPSHFQKQIEKIYRNLSPVTSQIKSLTTAIHVPHYSYYQKVDVLLRQKVIHRFFQSYFKKEKEEKDG